MLRRLHERLILVGVAHILPESRAEVEQVIAAERPAVVAVELCPARYHALLHGGEGPSAFDALRARRFGLFALNKLLYALQNRLAKQTGMPAGDEMLAAIERAREVGAKVEFIDRDIDITLQRLILRTGKLEKLRLLAELLIGLMPLGTRVDLRKMTEDAVLSQVLSSFKRASPTAYDVLIEERNDYMANRIVELLALTKGKILCVVGAGHLPGLCRRLMSQRWGWWGTSVDYEVSWGGKLGDELDKNFFKPSPKSPR
jgi:pheromone shutdown-related protein TraB